LLEKRDFAQADWSEWEQLVKLNFSESFSFAFSACLMPGVTHGALKASTLELLVLLVDISTEQSMSEDLIGYFAILGGSLSPEEFSQLRQQVSSLVPNAGSSFIFNHSLFTQKSTPLLFFAMLGAMLYETTSDQQLQTLFEFAKEAIEYLPGEFEESTGLLIPKLNEILAGSQNQVTVNASLALLQVMLEHQTDAIHEASLPESQLALHNFAGLPAYASFRNLSLSYKLSVCKLCCQIFGKLIDSP